MLHEKAMLVRLTIHAWTARKKDKKASIEVEQKHGAKEAGNFIKLLIDKRHLEPFQRQEGKIRSLFYSKTLAWGDSGERLLPSAIFFDFTSDMRTLIDEFERLANIFQADYDGMVNEARVKLGTLYDPADYPPNTEIRRRFSIDMDFYPVPAAQDFRVQVGEEEAARIKENITRSVEAKQKEATRECWDRLYEAVAKIEEVCLKDKPRIFDSLMDTPRELVRLLPKLNFAGDSNLDKMCVQVEERLIVEADDLRNNAPLRVQMARRALDVMQQIDGFR